jgi:hypothetical protein
MKCRGCVRVLRLPEKLAENGLDERAAVGHRSLGRLSIRRDVSVGCDVIDEQWNNCGKTGANGVRRNACSLRDAFNQPGALECLLNRSRIRRLGLPIGELLDESSRAILVKGLDKPGDTAWTAKLLKKSAGDCSVISTTRSLFSKICEGIQNTHDLPFPSIGSKCARVYARKPDFGNVKLKRSRKSRLLMRIY